MLQTALSFWKGFAITKNYDHSRLNRYGVLPFITQSVKTFKLFEKANHCAAETRCIGMNCLQNSRCNLPMPTILLGAKKKDTRGQDEKQCESKR